MARYDKVVKAVWVTKAIPSRLQEHRLIEVLEKSQPNTQIILKVDCREQYWQVTEDYRSDLKYNERIWRSLDKYDIMIGLGTGLSAAALMAIPYDMYKVYLCLQYKDTYRDIYGVLQQRFDCRWSWVGRLPII